jgi:predicted transcriptional regulator
MKRTTVFIEEGVERDLHALARRRDVPVSELVRESLTQYLRGQNRRQKFALRFLARGRSGRKDIAEHHEELLWGDLDPHESKGRQSRRG